MYRYGKHVYRLSFPIFKVQATFKWTVLMESTLEVASILFITFLELLYAYSNR